MNQYLDFFIAHWEYSLLFIAAFIWIVISQINERKASVWGVQPEKAIELINKKSALIFDLRDTTTFAQGHIVGAKQVTFKSTDDPKTLLKITPQTTCVFVCNLGQTTAKVVAALRSKGYSNTFSLNGGMTHWQKENLPIVIGK